MKLKFLSILALLSLNLYGSEDVEYTAQTGLGEVEWGEMPNLDKEREALIKELRRDHGEKYRGQRASEVFADLKQLFPNYKIYKLPEGAMVTKDYREDRIRIFYNPENKVTSINVG